MEKGKCPTRNISSTYIPTYLIGVCRQSVVCAIMTVHSQSQYQTSRYAAPLRDNCLKPRLHSAQCKNMCQTIHLRLPPRHHMVQPPRTGAGERKAPASRVTNSSDQRQRQWWGPSANRQRQQGGGTRAATDHQRISSVSEIDQHSAATDQRRTSSR